MCVCVCMCIQMCLHEGACGGGTSACHQGNKSKCTQKVCFFLQQDKHLLAVLSWDHYWTWTLLHITPPPHVQLGKMHLQKGSVNSLSETGWIREGDRKTCRMLHGHSIWKPSWFRPFLNLLSQENSGLTNVRTTQQLNMYNFFLLCCITLSSSYRC